MLIKKICKIATHPHLAYVLRNFAEELLLHPVDMTREMGKFVYDWLIYDELADLPKANEIWMEWHCHSHFSDGADLSDVVDKLFDKNIQLWSLTDHGNSNGFDKLVSGEYQLTSQRDRAYNVAPFDGRSLIICSGRQQLVLLRSVELWTKQGEINVHGYEGHFPKGTRIDCVDAIKRANDMGGFATINHGYFWEGIGFCGQKEIERAARAGAIAIEKNGTEIPPQMYSPVRSARDAPELGLRLVTSGDAHTLDMYGRSGEKFQREYSGAALGRVATVSPADAVRELIVSGKYENRLHYVTPAQFLCFFSFGTSEDKKA